MTSSQSAGSSPRDKARIHVIIFAIAITKSTSLPTDSVPSGSLSKRWHTTSGFRKTRRWQNLVMSPLFEKSPYTTKTAVQLRANDAVGRTLEEIDFNNTEKQGNKSYPGNVIEHVWFDHPADNISAPDFPEAEVELKVSPIDIKKSKDGPSCIAGERLVLNTINYAKESTADFRTSSFWKKNRFIELMQYLRRIASEKGQSEDKRKYKIKYAHLLAMDDFAEPNFPQNSLLSLSEATMLRIRTGLEHDSSVHSRKPGG